MEMRIQKVLDEQVNPILADHYGGAVLSAYENNIAWIRLTGACAACPSAQYTIEDVVRDIVLSNCEDVKDVMLDTTVSDDLLDMAKKILRKEV